MTQIYKCDWCGKLTEDKSTITTLEFTGQEYHYCNSPCIKEVRFALAVGKDGKQGKYLKIVECWDELLISLRKWVNANRPQILRDKDSIHVSELIFALNRFDDKLNKISNSEE